MGRVNGNIQGIKEVLRWSADGNGDPYSPKSSRKFYLKRVSEGNFILNNAKAYETVYTSSESGVKKKYRAVWLQKGSNIYVILSSAKVEDYDAQQPNFDQIINTFRVS